MIHVRNWEKYQHREATRRKGALLFIRLDVGTRRQSEFQGKGGFTRYAQWVHILEWAGETNNQIPYANSAWQREFDQRNAYKIRDKFLASGHLVDPDAITRSSPRCHHVITTSSQIPRTQGDTTGDATPLNQAEYEEEIARSFAREPSRTDVDVDKDKKPLEVTGGSNVIPMHPEDTLGGEVFRTILQARRAG